VDCTDLYISKIISLINALFYIEMKKDFIVSKIEASQDGSPYVYVAFTDPNEPKSQSGGIGGGKFPQSPFGVGIGAVPFTSPEDLMKNLPKVMSNMFGGGRMIGDAPIFKISMREYEDMQLKVGDKVTIEIKKANGTGV
jgi:hypothetical protein